MRATVLLTLVVGVLAAVPVAASCGQAHGEKAPCCFTNPRYVGVCKEAPSGEETCESILAYLNNPNSVGKAYCGNTDIRGGWAKVSCDQKKQTAPAPEPVQSRND
jgi:hypothetical protein